MGYKLINQKEIENMMPYNIDWDDKSKICDTWVAEDMLELVDDIRRSQCVPIADN